MKKLHMRLLITGFALGLLISAFMLLPQRTRAAACNSTGGGNWGTSGTWSCGHVPNAADDVTILAGHAISYNVANSTILTLTVAGSGTLNFNDSGDRSLTVSGTILNGGTIQTQNASGPRVFTLTSGGDFTNNGVFTPVSPDGTDVLNVVLNGVTQTINGTSATTFNALTINSSSTTQLTVGVAPIINTSITINGMLVMPDALTVTNDGAATVALGSSGLIRTADADGVTGAATTSFGLSFTTTTINTAGTVEYNASGNQTITGRTYQNLTTSGSGTKSPGGPLTINNAITLGAGTTLDENTRTMTLPGGASITVNGTLDFSSSTGLIQNGATGTTTLTMGSSGLIRTVDPLGLGPALNASLHTAGGTWIVTSIDTNGTVEYCGAAQTVTDRNYNHLVITNPGTKTWTLGGPATVNGNVTINTSAPLTLVNAQTVNVKGNWSNSGAFSAGTSTINFNGTSNQTIAGSSSTTFATLSIANTGTSPNNVVSLDGSTGATNTSTGSFSLTSGVFSQGVGASSSNLSTSGAGTVATISSGATWQSLGTGDVTLSGDVSNAGTITLNANGTSCGDADDILIRSAVTGTQRTWSGTGTFSMIDVDVRDQRTPAVPPPAAIFVTSGTNTANNTGWVFTGTCTSGTYTWIGGTLGANTDWQVATNWSPSRVTPAASDILIFDGNSTPAPLVTNVPTQTVAAIRLVNNNISVTLNASAVGPPHTLTLSGATGTDLLISSGTLLTLAGTNVLRMSVAVGSTASITGQMIVQDAAHRLIGNAANAVQFHSSGRFTTASGFTGNPFGTGSFGDGTTNSVQFESGSSYFHNAGDSPFGTAGLGPVAVFQTGSEADWLTNSGFQASGRSYANLVIGKGDPGGINVNVSDSGTGNFEFDNLFINGTNTNNSSLTFSGSGTSTVTIQGNITSGGIGPATLQDVTLTAGSGGIQIDAGGTITFGNVGNSRGILFGSDATVVSGTTLNLSRILQMGSTADGTVTDHGAIVHSSAAGYVVGAIRRPVMPSNYVFHVGEIIGYTPVGFANAVGGGDVTVQAVDDPRPSLDATKSLDEYWKITLNGGTLDSADLTFTYLDADVPGTSDENNYRVIRADGATVVNFPATILNTTLNTATVTGVAHFSDWTLGEAVSAATAVKFGRFNATSFADGVQLTWESGFEVDNLGYHVYRERNGQRTRITPSVIAGSALIVGQGHRMTAGNAYAWFDSEGTADSTYLLEAIDLDGSRQWAGPVASYAGRSAKGSKRQNRAKLLSAVAILETSASSFSNRSWPAAIKADASDLQAAAENATVQQAIAAGNAVKIAVNRDGWYRLTQAELTAAGLNPSSDARLLQLYVDGVEVPISLSTDNSRLNANDVLEFYGAALDTPTTDTRIYWLINGKLSGKRLGRTRGKVKTPNGNGPRSFEVTAERRDKIVYFPNLLNGEKDNLFGAPIFNDPLEQSITLTNISTESTHQPQLEIAVQGLTDGSHGVQLQLNGTYIGTISLSNIEHAVQSFTVNRSLLHEGANVVTLISTNGPGDISLVDWIRLTYSQQYKAINNALRFSAPGGQVVRVSGFTTSNVRVLDITNPASPATVAGSTSFIDGSDTLAVQTPGAGVRTLMAFTDGQFDHPAGLTTNQASTWNASSNGADMLIVTHRNFRDAIEPLANLRRGQGLIVAVVDIEDVYDEFSNGAHTPDALKAFLTSTSNWSRVPKYLLLVGDSTWDPRNYLGEGVNDFVPTKLIDTESMETASDDWLADFSNMGIPQMAVGRFPGRTATEISLMVSKTITYEQEREQNAALRGAVMVADNGFESQSSQTATLLPPAVSVENINRSQVASDDVMRGQIVNALNQGPMVVNYYGHGSVTVWTGAGLLDSDLATNLTNANRPSLYVMMTCLNGYASDAYIDSLGESALKAQNGAVAVWASSGFTSPEPQFSMNAEFYRQLFGGQPVRLGDAARVAKTATTSLDVRRTWILLGDPAMRIR